MNSKVTNFKLDKYLNPDLSRFIKKNISNDFFKTIEEISNTYNYKEIIPTLLNMLTDEVPQRDFIYYLDLLNHFLSQIFQPDRDYFIGLTKDKLYDKLKVFQKGDAKSILYQFIIDNAPLYDFNLTNLKNAFPIDQIMLLKKIVEIALKKVYLKFFLAYEILLFFDKNDINGLWEIIKTLDENEQIFIFYIFHSYLNDKNRKEMFKLLSEVDKSEYLKFMPYFQLFYPSKLLYVYNFFDVTSEDMKFDPVKIKNGLFNRTDLFYFSKNNTILLLTDFFEYNKYTFGIEFDFDFNYVNSFIFKQPTLFSKENYFRYLEGKYGNRIDIPFDSGINMFKAIFNKINPMDLSPVFILINHFFFKGTLRGSKYIFKTYDSHFDEIQFENLITEHISNEKFNNFIDFSLLFSEDVYELSKPNKRKYIKSKEFVKKFDDYINENKANILKKIDFLIELSILKHSKQDIYNFLFLSKQHLTKFNENYLKNIDFLNDFVLLQMNKK